MRLFAKKNVYIIIFSYLCIANYAFPRVAKATEKGIFDAPTAEGNLRRTNQLRIEN